MDSVKDEEGGLFIFSDEHDIGGIIDNFDDVLKDPLLSWAGSDTCADVQDIMSALPKNFDNSQYQGSFGNVSPHDLLDKSHMSAQDSSQMLDSMNVSHETSHDSTSHQNNVIPSFVKSEPGDRNSQATPELLKLLTNAQVPCSPEVASPSVATSDRLQNGHLTDPSHVLPAQTVPVQQQLPQPSTAPQGVSLQAPKLLISPQQATSLQFCSLLPNQTEEPRNAVIALSSHQQHPSRVEIAASQVASSASQQVPVQQLILHTKLPDSTAAMQRPIQLVIDSSKLPISSSSTCSVTRAPPVKAERHRAHNAIEKKYRTSINDKIVEMKNLLFGADAKIQKSGVLKKAIDHIKQLRNANTRLRKENMSYKLKLQQLGALTCVKSEDCDHLTAAEIIHAPLTPESLGDVHSSSSSSSSSPPASPCKSDDSFSDSSAMLDRTRVGLCIVMLAFFVFDPFNLVFSWHKGFAWPESSSQSLQSGHHAGGRMLMSQGMFEKQQPLPFPKRWFIFNLLSWFCRSLVVGFLLLKLFVFGEPSLQPDSKVAAKFWAFKRQADLTLEKGDYIAASKVLSRCLETLGRPLPTSRLDIACSLIWHLLRQVLHRLWVTRWLAAMAARFFSFRSADKKEMEWRRESAKQASLIYHQLHQLYLTGHVAGNSWLATVVALNAVNLAEMARNKLDEEEVVEIYVDAAIQMRSTLPKNLQFLSRYFLSRARRLCRGKSLTLPYPCWWLFTPIGHRFFVSGEWSCKRQPRIWNSSKHTENKPLVTVTESFCRFLLEQALSSLLLSKNNDEISSDSGLSSSEDDNGKVQALDLLHTLGECVNNSRKSRIYRNTKVFEEVASWPSQEADVVGRWWTAIGKVAACWLLGDTVGAQPQYKIIEDIPEELEKNDDPIGKALLMAFRARSLLENKDKRTGNLQEVLEHCDKGGALLRESIAFAAINPQNNLLLLVHLLCCDWLLSTRADIWEKESLDGNQTSESSRVDGFDKDLKSLQKVASYIPEALSKVYMYQATLRMLAGASPIQTQRLLQRSVLRQGCQAGSPCSLSTEKDRASALMLASSHLPPSLFSNNTERKAMVLEAVESLQKIGEKDRITRCRKLLLSI